MKRSQIKITHIITDLSMGGAEMMLYKLLRGMDAELFESRVISLSHDGPIGEKIRKSGIPTNILGLRPNFPNPLLVFRLLRWLKEFQPDVIQTWMYHADLIAGLSAKFIKSTPVVWGIRNSTLDPRLSKRSTILTMKACATISHRIPTRIVSCSEVVKRLHAGKGYAAQKMIVIPNGFDLDEFHPDPISREKVRSELGIPHDIFLIGHVGRYDPQKDYPTLLAAARLLHQRHPDIHFLLCGDGITWENTELTEMVDASGLRMVFHLIGIRSDIPGVTAAMDIATLTSAYGEGFPNVIGEAMACGIPCVVTDLGDSAYLVNDTGLVVPPRDPSALASAWGNFVEMSTQKRKRFGEAARLRIQHHFSLAHVVSEYQSLYQGLVNQNYP